MKGSTMTQSTKTPELARAIAQILRQKIKNVKSESSRDIEDARVIQCYADLLDFWATHGRLVQFPTDLSGSVKRNVQDWIDGRPEAIPTVYEREALKSLQDAESA